MGNELDRMRAIGCVGILICYSILFGTGLVLTVIGCQQPTPADPPSNQLPVGREMTAEEKLLVDAHNEYRKQKGLPALSVVKNLCVAAQGHADWMAANKRMSHTGKNGNTVGQRLKEAGYSYTYAGENIAAGYRTVDAVMSGWKGSAGHNNNMLGKNYSNIGVAVATASNGTRYWCVDFGRVVSGVTAQEIPKENLPEGIEEASISAVPRFLVGDVVAVYDGDTLTLDLGMGAQQKIRLAGVDAPEKAQQWGTNSQKVLEWCVLKRKVLIQVDTKDRYGRYVGWVYPESTPVYQGVLPRESGSINALLISGGMGWHYKQYDSSALLEESQKHARDLKIGLWSENNPIPPWEYRKKIKGSEAEE